MGSLRLEKRKRGVAVVLDGRQTPLGYVRDGRWWMQTGVGDFVACTPEDLEALASEIRESQRPRQIFRLHSGKSRVVSSRT